MNWIGQKSGLIFAATFLVVLGLACGDDELSGENAGDPDNQNQNQAPDNQNQNQNQEDEDCEDDETYNPITGECVPVEENQNQNDPNQESLCAEVECDDGLVCDPSTGDCVECVGDGHCEEGYVCDTDASECVEDSEAPTECTTDDDCADDEVCNTDIGECEEEFEFECGPGGIVGETCTAADGVLPGATVIVEGYDCDGVAFSMETTAGNDGAYEFTDVPAGSHTLTITSGSFEISDDVSVQTGEVTDRKSVGEKLCFVGTEVDIAVATGGWDDIAGILDDMNIEYDTIANNSSFFSDLDQMRDYDIIFTECGTDTVGLGGGGFGVDSDDIAYNVRRYVEEGHSLYSSDLASNFVEYTIPEAAEFDGSGSSQTVTADVVSDQMQLLLESETAEVVFNMGGWRQMKDVGPATEVQFRGDVSNAEDIPFMIIYDDPIGGGRAIYTSFHNNNQASDDMEDILEFMIFQL